MKNSPARKIPKLTSAIRDRMRKAIAEEEQPHVIAAT